MSTFERILADLDPRDEGQPALDRVRQIANAKGSSVELFHCDSLDHVTGHGLFADSRLEESREEYKASLGNWLDEQARVLSEAGIEAKAGFAWHAPRYEAILDKAREIEADLVIRGAKAHSKLERLLVSATDWELIRRAPQTVWLVKKRPASTAAGINVVAAVDPVHAEERKVGLDRRILDTAASIAAIGNGALHVFHAWQPGAAIAPAIAAGPHVPMPVVRVDADLIEGMRAERQELLGELSRPFDIAADRVHLREGAVTGELDHVVSEQDIDVVVAGGVSRGRLERLVIGSTAEAILESVDCDVVVVKPDRRGD